MNPTRATTAPRPLLWLVLLCFAACTDKSTLPPIPEALLDAAQVPGFAGTRQWGEASAAQAPGRNPAQGAPAGAANNGPLNALALSGGASNGTFSAGLLSGWSESGTRPRFHVVSGVSIGALAAPFAFLGPKYDGVLRQLFTGVAGQDIIVPRPRWLALFGDSMASSRPLRELIGKHFDRQMVEHEAAVDHHR